MNYFAHPLALIESKKIGSKTSIYAFTHVLPNAVIGKNVNIAEHCFIENKVKIGDNSTLKCGVYLWDGITVENNVFIGPNATFTNDKYPRSKNKKYKQLTTILRKGCSIGANTTILPGITIGEYAIIGAGTVITKNVENYTIYYGNPGKLIGYICKCGIKLKFIQKKAKCPCGERYDIENSLIKNIK